MRCKQDSSPEEDYFHIVKFQNNPQHPRILANEMLGTALAARLGLPTAPREVIEVGPDLIELTRELVIQLGVGHTSCRAGRQFGSGYPGDPRQVTVHDFLPDEQLRQVENLDDFIGMLVFDKWTCNTNGRQAIFFKEPGRSRYQAWMIDQGFCFNAGEWNFPDAPLRGLYARHRVYESVQGMESFEPWLGRLEKCITERLLDEVQSQIPPEWYNFEQEALFRLLEQLYHRRRQVRDWIVAAKNSYRQPFLNWK